RPGWLPFNRKLLLAYLVPLVIWTGTSIAVVIALEDGLASQERIELAERAVRLASEYQDAFLLLRDGADFYFHDPSAEALARREGILRRANGLFTELAFLARGRPAQLERLERAGTNLQEWFHDVAV